MNLDRRTGVGLGAVNLPLRSLDLAAHLRERFGVPVGIENDGNAIALAEWRVGAGPGATDLVALALGTGVGGGVVLDGRLYRGWAELGHVVVVADGPPCQGNCHGHGHLEAVASGRPPSASPSSSGARGPTRTDSSRRRSAATRRRARHSDRIGHLPRARDRLLRERLRAGARRRRRRFRDGRLGAPARAGAATPPARRRSDPPTTSSGSSRRRSATTPVSWAPASSASRRSTGCGRCRSSSARRRSGTSPTSPSACSRRCATRTSCCARTRAGRRCSSTATGSARGACVSVHRHNEARQARELIPRLEAGETHALVSDAGLPGVNDPGSRLVGAALDAGVEVTVLPGPSAVETALVASGLGVGQYRFLGYLPRRRPSSRRCGRSRAAGRYAAVAFESPKRLTGALVAVLAAVDPERRLAVCRELTKRFEETVARHGRRSSRSGFASR